MQNPYKVLLVMPKIDGMDPLDQTREKQWIQLKYHTPVVLEGFVTPEQIWAQTNDQTFDIIHFATHADANGIYFSEVAGKPTRMTMDDVARLGRTRRVKLIYVASCNSPRLAQYVVDNGVPAVIISTMPVSDTQVWSTAISFYSSLLENGGDFALAYDLVKPRDGSLSMFSNGAYTQYGIKRMLARLDEQDAGVRAANEKTNEVWQEWTKIKPRIEDALEVWETDILPDLDQVRRGHNRYLDGRTGESPRQALPTTIIILIIILMIMLLMSIPVSLFILRIVGA